MTNYFQTIWKKSAHTFIKKIVLTLVVLLAALIALAPSQKASATPAYPPSSTCPTNVATNGSPCYAPYFVVQGGDLAGGSSFCGDNNSGNCSTQFTCKFQSAMFFGGWNNNNYSNAGNPRPFINGYYGTAVQGATFTPDTAQEIASDINSDFPLANSSPEYTYTYNSALSPHYLNTDYAPFSPAPYYLGFANQRQNIQVHSGTNYAEPVPGGGYNGWYGGDFGNLPCMPDSYGQAMAQTGNTTITGQSSQTICGQNPVSGTTSNPILDLSKLCGGTYVYTSSGLLTINDTGPITAATIANGKPLTVVDSLGSILIASNIKYSYTSLNNIPQLSVIMGGGSTGTSNNGPSLNIDYHVSEIDGFYAVGSNITQQPSWVNTCSNGNTPMTTYTSCDQNQLLVDGSLESDYIYPERTYGDLNTMTVPSLGSTLCTTNTACASELFRYSPELWVPYATATTTCSGGGGGGGAGTITAVGNLKSGNSPLVVNAGAAGDVWILALYVSHLAGHVGVSGGGVPSSGAGQWTPIEQQHDNTNNDDVEEWMGTIQAPGPPITITGSGGNGLEVAAQEFTAGYGSTTTWSIDGTPGADIAQSGTTIKFPSLSPAGSNELYAGYSFNGQYPPTPAGSYPGFTYVKTGLSNIFIYNPAVSSPGPYAPTASQPSSYYDSLGAIIKATGSGGGGGTETFGGNCVGYNYAAETGLPPVL